MAETEATGPRRARCEACGSEENADLLTAFPPLPYVGPGGAVAMLCPDCYEGAEQENLPPIQIRCLECDCAEGFYYESIEEQQRSCGGKTEKHLVVKISCGNCGSKQKFKFPFNVPLYVFMGENWTDERMQQMIQKQEGD